ncbi:thiamine ABC transporter substrate-binding protein [Bdellovibrio bacteriovorus]|uniref:Thiamine ABC transporter substrate-binding protein n=1 Tax=Bdellovibrio bacteriovorus TaxID=959 RepID=A0A1Z3NBN7_BDEBC|nr:thiamine ABC transporter substrate-binding protein [Bdellovibrio bacteriovorus]ASD64855.1 thiamine ABC transporter substrate-binding protein [Bdellovibrio bacteriovorus]
MKHFVLFLTVVFLGLFLAVLNRTDTTAPNSSLPTVRVFGYASFTGRWGPGPALKDLFEKNCKCKVEFIEGSDSGILLQRLKIEGESLGADVVVGLDQFDLSKAVSEQSWRKLSLGQLDVYDAVKPALANSFFVPYDWGALTFVARKNELMRMPASLDDLLAPELAKKIALQDPRTSSPGMQFLYWVIRAKGEEEGFRYLQKLMSQVHSFSPTWSTAYGLFTNKQTKLVYSYVTSPLYHEIEEKKKDYVALPFNEALPVQFEFVGIPEFCRHCDLAEQFVNLMLSNEGQKIIMEKNYMFPVMKGVMENTSFAPLMNVKTMQQVEILSSTEVDRLLRRWTEIRRGDLN